MSRDRRQRANQRRSRRTSDGGPTHPGDLVRSNLPGALGHSSSEVDEFDAALVKGAGGAQAPLQDEPSVDVESDEPSVDVESASSVDVESDEPSVDVESRASDVESRASRREDPVEDWFEEQAGDEDDGDDGDLAAGGSGSGSGGGGGGGGGREVVREDAFGRDRPARPPAGRPLPVRAVGFVRASWAELNRVQWPDREQVFQATAVVLGFVAIAGIYLGVADWVAEHVIKAIL